MRFLPQANLESPDGYPWPTPEHVGAAVVSATAKAAAPAVAALAGTPERRGVGGTQQGTFQVTLVTAAAASGSPLAARTSPHHLAQSITAMPMYASQSAEELRMADYQKGNFGAKPAAAGGFGAKLRSGMETMLEGGSPPRRYKVLRTTGVHTTCEVKGFAKRSGQLGPGEEIVSLEERTDSRGRQRVRFERGWVSFAGKVTLGGEDVPFLELMPQDGGGAGVASPGSAGGPAEGGRNAPADAQSAAGGAGSKMDAIVKSRAQQQAMAIVRPRTVGAGLLVTWSPASCAPATVNDADAGEWQARQPPSSPRGAAGRPRWALDT